MWMQETGFGRDQSPPPVHVDRASLHHDPGIVDRETKLLPDPGGDHIVEVVRGILVAPGVVLPVHDRLARSETVGRALDENGTVIPAPRVVGGKRSEERRV